MYVNCTHQPVINIGSAYMEHENFVSLNCWGLGEKQKRIEIFKWLKKEHKGIVFLQETHSSKKTSCRWETDLGRQHHIYFSHGSTDSRGVAIIIPKQTAKSVIKVIDDDEGRMLIVKIDTPIGILNLINVYAPTQDHVKEQVEFVNRFQSILQSMEGESVIAGGDWNIILNPKLDKWEGENTPQTQASKFLCEVIESENLLDIWRVKNPEIKRYTWRRKKPLRQSRLDYWLITDVLIYKLIECDILPSIRTDHSLIQCKLTYSESTRGKGYWKLNTSLLLDTEYEQRIKTMLIEIKPELDQIEDRNLAWEMVKQNIRKISISYSIYKKGLYNKECERIKSELEALEIKLSNSHEDQETENLVDQHDLVKKEWDDYHSKYTRGAIIRSKCQWVEEGEKCTSYFLNLEKHNQEKKNITMLNIEHSNQCVKSQKDILLQIEQYYANVYRETSCENRESSIFTKQDGIPSISEQEKKEMDRQINEEECLQAVSDLPINKSPGTDGIPTEFYKHFWNEIKDYLLESYRYSFEKGELSIEQKRGLITLIPKGDKDSTLLKNWRPISLLNCDYKILAKLLANRLHEVISTLISNDQAGYIHNRYIGNNIRVIDDLLSLSDSINLTGIILLLDFEKAFDSLNWDFLQDALESFNFGENFQRWIGIMYNNTSSSVLNNGHGTRFFPLSRGIRQGCPISALLFILCVELLAIKIRNSKDICGISISDHEIKINQFADDTAVFLEGMGGIKPLLNVLREFAMASGLKLNKSKTEVINLGTQQQCNISDLGLKWTENEFRYLGIWFHKDNLTKEYLNYRHRMEKIKNLLRMWLVRDLSLKGKVTVLKSLIVSMLIYPFSNIQTPEWVINECNTLFFKFLWNGKPDKVKRNIIIQQIQDGGLKMVDIESTLKSCKVNWVKRYMDDNNEKWKWIPEAIFGSLDIAYFLTCRFIQEDLPGNLPPFYIQMFLAYQEIYKDIPTMASAIKEESLWCNKLIKANNFTLFYREWFEAGIKYVGDVVDDAGELLQPEQLESKYNVHIKNFLQYFSLRQSIPYDWKKSLRGITDKDSVYNQETIMPSVQVDEDHCIDIVFLPSKDLYWLFIKGKKPKIMANEMFWENEYKVCPETWQELYYLPYTAVRETKLQSFQYKILQLIYATGLKLSQWRIKTTSNCSLCLVTDTLAHHFVDCKRLTFFWKPFCKWWNGICNNCFTPNCVNILLGDIHNRCHALQLNYVLLKAKWYINKQQILELECDFFQFLVELKSCLLQEKYIYNKNKKLVKFDKLWKEIVDDL